MKTLRAIFPVYFLCCLAITAYGTPSDYNVFFRNKTFTPAENKGIVSSEELQTATFEETVFAFIQFYNIPTQEQRNLLKNHNIHLGDYIKRNAYTATFPTAAYPHLSSLPFIRSVFFQPPDLKVEQRLQNSLGGIVTTQTDKNEERINLAVALYKGTNHEAATLHTKNRIEGSIFTETTFGTYTVNVSKNQIGEIAALPFVLWAEERKYEFTPLDIPSVNLHRGNILSSTLPNRRGLKGSGVHIGQWDGSGIGQHIDFSDRLTNIDPFVAGLGGTHATQVGGVMAGAGNRNPAATGIAPKSSIFSWDYFGNLILEIDAGTAFYNLAVANHSYAIDTSTCVTRGSYTDASEIFDLLSLYYSNLLQVYAAGNSRGNNCLGGGYGTVFSGLQVSKNGLTVGSVTATDGNSSNHSYGPAMDGRIKPDICARGVSVFTTDPNNNYTTVSATSYSAPNASGTAALLYEHYRNLNSGNDPQSHTIKAILMNTAQDLGNPGPDYIYGYGRIDGDKAATVLDSNQYIVSDIVHGDSLVDTLTISVSSNTQEIRFMLAWTDVPQITPAALALVNDLDLLIIDPNGDTLLPLVLDHTNPSDVAVEKTDTLNNNEQVVVRNVIAGDYKIVVLGTAVPSGTVDFTLTWWETEPFIRLTYPIGGEKWTPPSSGATQQIIAWDGFDLQGTITLEFSEDNGTSWTTLASGLDSSARYYVWNNAAPSLHTGQALIRVSTSIGGMTSQNDTPFTIMVNPQNNGVSGISCSEQITLFWNPLAPSDTFKIFQLIGEEMTEIARTTDTFYIVTGLTNGDTYWFAISGIDADGYESRRSLATSHVPDATNSPPSITTQPTDQNVCQFADCIFTSVANGIPAPNSQWQISTDSGMTWTDISGETSNDLTISGTDSGLTGNLYRNSFFNTCGGIYFSDTVFMNIDSIPPQPLIITNPLTACGDTTQLSSSVTNPILFYNWTLEDAESPVQSGINLTNITGLWNIPDNTGTKTIILTLSYPANNCSNTDTTTTNLTCGLLPAEFLNLRATPFDNHVLIEWETTNEINNDHFTILKSEDLQHWEPTGTVKGAGNSYSLLSYKFADNNPVPGMQYYQIRQTDFDGNFKYSKTVDAVFNPRFSEIRIKPNPTDNLLFIESPGEFVNIKIKDLTGKTIVSAEQIQQQISVKDIAPGIYFIEIKADGKTEIFRLVKQ